MSAMAANMDEMSLERIRKLGCWNGAIDVAPLKGGISNESYLVSDASGRHVVRFGQDYPFHQVFRDREVMTARAAHAAGFGPAVEFSAPGVMVSEFIDARTFQAEDVKTNLVRIAALLKSFHASMARQVSGAAFMFWPFYLVREYARTLQDGNSRMTGQLPYYLCLADQLEAAQAPLPIVFAHNDLLPANILDDGARLWLIDFEYAGFSTAMFDLSGATSNAGFSAQESEAFLAAYFGARPDPEILKAHAAMECVSLLREAMWSMVSELYLSAPGADYETYTEDNLKRLLAALDTYQSKHGKLDL